MVGFNELRSRLASTGAAKDMDAVALLDPFLEVIQSGDTNGPITGAALSSVEKFLMCKIISKWILAMKEEKRTPFDLDIGARDVITLTDPRPRP